jgi:hypothetical protein
MDINIKNFTFKTKESVKVGNKIFSVNNIEKSDVEQFNKKIDRRFNIWIGLIFSSFIFIFIATGIDYEKFKFLYFLSLLYALGVFVGFLITTYKDTVIQKDIENIYFVRNLKDYEKDIEKLSIEFPFTYKTSRCKINIETTSPFLRPFYFLPSFTAVCDNTLEDKYIVDFNKKEIIY